MKSSNLENSKSRVARNNSKGVGLIIVVAVLTVTAIVGLIYLVNKNNQTVTVAMYANSLSQNNVITQDDIVPFEMTLSDYEKYSYTTSDGVTKRRILTWDEASLVYGTFVAYGVRANSLVFYQDIIRTRIDNSDSVLYSYPGTDLITLKVGTDDLSAFKTYLQPGDKVTIDATYTDSERIVTTDEFGNDTTEDVEVYRQDTVFKSITLADMLNGSGDSILDIYADYNTKSTYEQAVLDADETFQNSIVPATIVLALTPKEKEEYYKYLVKDNVTFRMSLPQRIQ